MFGLTKWYMDLVTADGTVFIGYAARLRWGRVRARYASALVAPPSGLPRETTTVRDVVRPQRTPDGLTWGCEPLGLRGEWVRRSDPFRRGLVATPDGHLRWSCVVPGSDAQVRLEDGRVLGGLGYAERIDLTIPPWKLPFDTLRWGRFLSPGHALVWIDWGGWDPRRWVWLDGVLESGAEVGEASVSLPGAGRELCLGEPRVLRDHRVFGAIAAALPGLARHMPGVTRGIRETKLLSEAALRDAGGAADRGWVIHETVSWPSTRPAF